MTPPPPPDYSKAAGAGLTRLTLIDQQTRMILRQIIRWPARAALTVAGVAASVALLVGTLFFTDSIDAMIETSFTIANRQGMSVTFTEPRSRAALHAIARQPGVLAAEPFRAVPARLTHGPAQERVAITGAPLDSGLSRLIDAEGRPVRPPPGGLVLTDGLAARLGVRAGEVIGVQATEGRRPSVELPVSAVATSYVGSAALMEIGDLNRLMGEGPLVSGAHLSVDRVSADALYARLKEAPVVAGVGLQSLAMERLQAMMDENLGRSLFVFVTFAGVIALGVVYNSVRISYAERQRELASLRVLGFSRADVSYILLGEVALLTLIALPLGAAAGTGLAWHMTRAMGSEMFTMPFVIAPSTYGTALAVVLAVTAGSSLLVRRQIDRLDMAQALKTGE